MTAGFDIVDAADLRRKELREAIACGVCGNPEPVRVEAAGCEACVAFPQCWLCGRWTDINPSTSVALPDGSVADLCDTCRERGDGR